MQALCLFLGSGTYISLVKASQWPCATPRKQGSTIFFSAQIERRAREQGIFVMYTTVVHCFCHQEAYIRVVESQILNEQSEKNAIIYEVKHGGWE